MSFFLLLQGFAMFEQNSGPLTSSSYEKNVTQYVITIYIENALYTKCRIDLKNHLWASFLRKNLH